jgi:ubiquitin-conjugating enzyme E2 J1
MSPTIRRLMKEAAELSASSPSPSPHFCAHPVSDSNLFDWHFTIAGPPAPSPYAGGIYHGRIVLPPQYPLRPPSFRFLTPSGRFEVNREICLSISGHHEETWQPAWGIRTALIAIRSFMDGDAKGQLGGLDATDEVRRMWAAKSRSWRCEACSAGKTNEQILKEWREVCLQKGIAVDEEGREFVPEELKMHYRKEAEKSSTSSPPPSQVDKPVAQEDGARDEPSMSTSSGLMTETKASIRDPPSTSEARHNTAPAIPSSPSSSSFSSPHNPSTEASSTAPVVSTRPTTTTTTTTTTVNSTTSQHATTSSPSSDGPWLDRAIIVVLVALIFMILRRIANTEETI